MPTKLKGRNPTYIGESGRNFGKCLSEYKSCAASSKSAVIDSEYGVWSDGHVIDWTEQV